MRWEIYVAVKPAFRTRNLETLAFRFSEWFVLRMIFQGRQIFHREIDLMEVLSFHFMQGQDFGCRLTPAKCLEFDFNYSAWDRSPSILDLVIRFQFSM